MLPEHKMTTKMNMSTFVYAIDASTSTPMLGQPSLNQGVTELDLEQEWIEILGDGSELAFLAFSGRNV